jgi:hypothetical protein
MVAAVQDPVHDLLAHHAQGHAGQGDAHLAHVERLVHAVDEHAQPLRPGLPGGGQLRHAGAAHLDHGEFRQHEGGVEREQQQEDKTENEKFHRSSSTRRRVSGRNLSAAPLPRKRRVV